MKPILILGTFDGVHIGHQSLFKKGMELREEGCPVAAVFSCHPAKVLCREISLLTTTEEKLNLIHLCGVGTAMVDFTPLLAAMTPKEYFDFLCRRFSPQAFIIGRNHTFGKDASGTAHELARFCSESGTGLYVVPSELYKGEPISSTRIKRCLADGRPDEAAAMLGRPYFFSASVESGKALGRTLGFPTANTVIPSEKILPKTGVYVSAITVKGKKYGAVTDLGNRPTVEGHGNMRAESFIFSFSGDIYGEDVTVELLKYIREERHFKSSEELRTQVSDDCAIALSYLKTRCESVFNTARKDK